LVWSNFPYNAVMSQPAPAGAIQIPEWGFDHLVLADWRTSVLREQPRDHDGAQPATHTTSYQTPAGIRLGVELERGAATDFPTAQDDDVLLGLIYLAHEQGFPNIVRFVPDRLARIIRWPRNAFYYRRIAAALDRYRKLSATFHHNWYSKKDRAVALKLMTGVIAQAEIVTRRGRRSLNDEGESHVQWTENFAQSLREANTLPINLNLFYALSRPSAKQLYRQLNKTWRGGLKPVLYERDLREIACGHLGMRPNKYLKRNFQLAVSELETKGYLTPLPEEKRYHKIAQGIWRVSFELHPAHYAKRSRTTVSVPTQTAISSHAHTIVCQYHEQRFGRKTYRPKPKELAHAEELIAQFGDTCVVDVTNAVVQLVRAQQQHDLYFGFAVPYYRQLLESPAVTHGFRGSDTSTGSEVSSEQERVERALAERREQRSKLLLAWCDAAAPDRARYRQSALQRAESETVRRRIRQSSIDEPPHEVLQEMALALSAGKS
jgi:hypothetical protein